MFAGYELSKCRARIRIGGSYKWPTQVSVILSDQRRKLLDCICAILEYNAILEYSVILEYKEIWLQSKSFHILEWVATNPILQFKGLLYSSITQIQSKSFRLRCRFSSFSISPICCRGITHINYIAAMRTESVYICVYRGAVGNYLFVGQWCPGMRALLSLYKLCGSYSYLIVVPVLIFHSAIDCAL